ncbi:MULTISPECIES: DUF3857 domain-containing protein [Flavobacterium]|uniref:DUF3857 domain-containing protein n=1 Tax=Flavobacterium jumunjinense TaxID=998845 RepID=A0ABV5GL73_9FLAO|nr:MULTISPECIES: DUF3857 domain-containing protein [Flavobacterium]
MKFNFLRVFVLFGLFFSGLVFSQNYELGEVTIEELQEVKYSNDPNAEAVVLFENGKTYFQYDMSSGFNIITEVEKKIKIYSKEGLDWANKTVKYYTVGKNEERVSFSKAITYNLENGKIEKTKLRNDGEFDEKINKYWSQKKIVMPNVKVGSIIEYKYTIKSPNYSTFPIWNFQYSIPVKYSSFKTYIPEYFLYNNQFKGELVPVVDSDTKMKTFTGRYTKDNRRSGGSNFERESYEVEYKEYFASYFLSNVPAMKDEKFVNNIENYVSAIYHELSSVNLPYEAIVNYSSDWESVAKTIMNYEGFGNELSRNDYYKKEIDELLTGIVDQKEKIILIFEYVKNRMNWNNGYGYLCDNGVRKAYVDKVGNVAEINLMLTSMLRYAGVEANPILVSTRSNGVPIFPSRSAFNYVITGVELQDNLVLFDATNKYSLPNVLPIRDLNWFGRLIRDNRSSTLVDLMPKMKSIKSIMLLCDINANGDIKGKVRKQISDYNAFVYRDKYFNVDKESYIDKLNDDFDEINISEYKIDNVENLSQKIVETFSFVDNKNVENIGGKLYFSPMMFFKLNENPFKLETRKYPIDFNFPFKDSYVFTINIPEGYVVEYLPEAANIILDNNYGGFNYVISEKQGKIQLAVNYEINTSIIPASNYEFLKSFFKMMIEKQAEKIILIKE